MALCSFHLLHYEHHIGSCAQDRHQVSSDQVARWKVELGKHHQFPCPVVKSGAMRSRWDSDKLQQDRYMSVRWDPSQSQKASKLIRRHIQLCRGIIIEGNNHRRKSTQGSVGGPRVAIYVSGTCSPLWNPCTKTQGFDSEHMSLVLRIKHTTVTQEQSMRIANLSYTICNWYSLQCGYL